MHFAITDSHLPAFDPLTSPKIFSNPLACLVTTISSHQSLPCLTTISPSESVRGEQGAADKRGSDVTAAAGGGPGGAAGHRGRGPVPRPAQAGSQQSRVRRLHSAAGVGMEGEGGGHGRGRGGEDGGM